MTYDWFENLPVWQAAITPPVRMYELTNSSDFAGHANLRDQIKRATVSVSNNFVEGFEWGTTQEFLTFLYFARGSAGEVRSMLCLLEKLPRFKNLGFQISNLKSLAENISRQLQAWADSLQNSPIQGQRYLTEETRRIAQQASRSRAFREQLRRIGEESWPGGPGEFDDDPHEPGVGGEA